MSNTLSDNKQTHATRVFTAIESKAAAATSMVAASWARSVRLHGLLPDGARPTERHGQSELSQRQERLQRVLHVSGRTLDRLYSTIALSGCGIFLCDSDGVVLERLTSDGGATEFDSSGLSIGADWSEASQGTNGIGTCIAEGRAVSIQREQHFIASNIAMSCMGAPIFDAQGALAAVLDISSCRADIEGPVVQLIAQAVSDAAIVSGLIAVLLRIYSDRRPQDIIGADAGFVSALGLEKHLSPTRSNGLASMLKAIRRFAEEALQTA